MEHTLACLGNFRRLLFRYDRSITIYEAFFSYRLLHGRLTEGQEIASSHFASWLNPVLRSDN